MLAFSVVQTWQKQMIITEYNCFSIILKFNIEGKRRLIAKIVKNVLFIWRFAKSDYLYSIECIDLSLYLNGFHTCFQQQN